MYLQLVIAAALGFSSLVGGVPPSAEASVDGMPGSSTSTTLRTAQRTPAASPDDIAFDELAIVVPPVEPLKIATSTPSLPAPPSDPDQVIVDRLVDPARIVSDVVATTGFQTVGVTWPEGAEVGDLGGQVRARTDGTWSDWVDLEPGDDAPDAGTADADRAARGGTDPVSIGDADAIQLAFTASRSAQPQGLTLALIGSETTPAPDAVIGARSDGGANVAAASYSTTTVQAASAPRVITRAEWGAPPQVCAPDVAAKLVGAVVHHTAGSNSYTSVAQAMQQIRNDAAYHISGRGWCDIGYNFIVDKWGNIYEGRANSLTQAVIGVHAGGFNTGTVGVSMLGTYDAVPSPETQRGVGQIIGWRLGAYGVDPLGSMTYYTGAGENSRFLNRNVNLPRIMGHRDVAYTACPGAGGYAALGNIRSIAAAGGYGSAFNAEPVGQFDSVTVAATSVTVRGWVIDPDTQDPIVVHIYVDAGAKAGLADLDRPDLARYFTNTKHGFEVTVGASSGTHQVCAYAINVPVGNNVSLGCRTITVAAEASMPVGQLETITTGTSSVNVRGWTLDPDTSEPIAVHVYVDAGAKAGLADLDRPDLARYFTGTNHGYDITVPAAPGTHQVCVYAINVPAGNNPALACRTVTVDNAQPVGQVESLTAGNSTVVATGWALDPDTTGPISVKVYVDGVVGQASADVDRLDLARYFTSTQHGFTITVPTTPGVHQVCVHAINTPAGPNPALTCRTITIANALPVGQVESITTAAGSVTVKGWTVDPDTAEPIAVHVYVDSGAKGAVANLDRPDLAQYFASTQHGYSVTVPAGPGRHVVCVYAINVPTGNNPALGCRAVTT